ncbi:lasso RiPP family leader peptide-containing protein [Streptomyces sp. NPDC049837]
MRDESETEEAEVYEPPVLADAGGYAEVTEGYSGLYWDGFSAFFGLP